MRKAGLGKWNIFTTDSYNYIWLKLMKQNINFSIIDNGELNLMLILSELILKQTSKTHNF